MERKLRVETLIYGAGRYGSIVVTLLTTVVLSHILSPEEYGVTAVTAVFSSFFTVVADMGFGTAVIQNKTLTDGEVNDIFSFSVYASLALGALFALLGFPIAVFYGNPAYRKICALLSLAVTFTGMNIVPHGVVMKGKRFRVAGLRLITLNLATGALAILMALAGFSYYALVLQSVMYAFLVFVWNFCHVKLKFRLRVNMKSVRRVSGFSMYQFAYSLVNYLSGNFDHFLISRAMGSVGLAYYDKSYRLMMYPVQNLTYVISPIIHPVLSEHQDDRRYIYDAYMKIVRALSLAGVLIAAVCFSASREIILLFFGAQWESSASVFRILAPAVWPMMVVSSAKAIYQSTGNTRLLLRSGGICFGAGAVLTAAGVMTGSLETTARCVAAALYLRFFIDYYFLIVRNFGYGYGAFLRSFRGEACIAAGMAAAIAALEHLPAMHLLAGMAVKGGVLLAVFVAAAAATGQLKPVREFLHRRRHNRKNR